MMRGQIGMKIVSAIICIFIILIGLTADTLIFESIVMSHYGGLRSIYSPYILSLIISLAVGVAFFAPSILSLVNTKPYWLKLLFIIVLASLSCFILIGVAWRLQVGMYGSSISEIFGQHIFYMFTSGFVIQLLFLDKQIALGISGKSKIKCILRVLVFLLTVILSATLLNIGSIYEAFERRENQPNYMKGNSRLYRVVLDEKCGVSPRIEDGKVIIEFPKNGLVILQANENDLHTSDCKFYFINENNERQELYLVDIWNEEKEVVDEYEISHNVKGAIGSNTDYVLGTEGDGTYSSAAPSAITYWDIIIHSESFPFNENNGQQMHSLTKSIVNECREKNQSRR